MKGKRKVGRAGKSFLPFYFRVRAFGLDSVSNPGTGYNLGQNKMEQQTPIPLKSRMKPRAA